MALASYGTYFITYRTPFSTAASCPVSAGEFTQTVTVLWEVRSKHQHLHLTSLLPAPYIMHYALCIIHGVADSSLPPYDLLLNHDRIIVNRAVIPDGKTSHSSLKHDRCYCQIFQCILACVWDFCCCQLYFVHASEEQSTVESTTKFLAALKGQYFEEKLRNFLPVLHRNVDRCFHDCFSNSSV